MKCLLHIAISLLTLFPTAMKAQHSIARDWNEILLEAIRKDYARPTVHARNLFHSAIIMYDAWAVFDKKATTVFLGKTFGGYTCKFNGIVNPVDTENAIHEIISYGMYRLLNHRFAKSPGNSIANINAAFLNYGYDPDFTSLDYTSGSYAALGNYLANEIISFGLQDGSNEPDDYGNTEYYYSNLPLILKTYTDTNDLLDPNRWQPLAFNTFIDQSGNIVPSNVPRFLSPEWGKVTPFCLQSKDLKVLNNGFDSYVYNDPGPPPYIQNSTSEGIDDPYKWHFALVASWSSHLDPEDPTLIDISPGSIGNVDISEYPNTFEDYKKFYNFDIGGDIGKGHVINPITDEPYNPQLVKRADYARSLAEFWADGPDSETPPGHWFTILNYINDHPEIIKKIGGEGELLSNLEWDIKSYLSLGGAMHDVAVNIWGIKGYYDYIRPISAIRYMAGKGQSTNPTLASFDPHGLPLIDGLIELISSGDPLSGDNNEHVGHIKIKAWKGPDYITNPDTDIAGVDWILGSHWWPYQRGTFVTPPFAGYLSGHSAFSRAGADILTKLTGDPFFPGGMGIFDIQENEFLVFEKGPSENLILQWATYQDASDQSSLSRMWGGIHPPIDDIKGRFIGNKIANEAFDLASQYFNGTVLSTPSFTSSLELEAILYPLPFKNRLNLSIAYQGVLFVDFYAIDGKKVFQKEITKKDNDIILDIPQLTKGLYIVKIRNNTKEVLLVKKVFRS